MTLLTDARKVFGQNVCSLESFPDGSNVMSYDQNFVHMSLEILFQFLFESSEIIFNVVWMENVFAHFSILNDAIQH